MSVSRDWVRPKNLDGESLNNLLILFDGPLDAKILLDDLEVLE